MPSFTAARMRARSAGLKPLFARAAGALAGGSIESWTAAVWAAGTAGVLWDGGEAAETGGADVLCV
ncbi:hypothetical protein GKA01_19260 [Gluconobacter kanchanaburiensis NBRC 103587]|uniref:Uncharacterized protein n=1 Tax=Gluconobacter kanchanaburiensis NBRC 103587 TaxID=1307948 RepID=A0A511B8J0_9PROT|nr:hypothetical protein GKA01_19260 [Gluconobacter kanchanaburiensis NBRC 103587]